MFFILSKTVYYVAMPMVWLTALVIWALVTKKVRLRQKLLIAAASLLVLLGNKAIVNGVFTWWEYEPTPIEQLQPHNVAIVLTGVANLDKEPADRVYLQKGADRVTHTVHLYKKGLVNKILISGGSGKLVGEQVKEAPKLKQLFIRCGVPAGDIIIEKQSRNTHENAYYSAQLLQEQFPGKKYLLITSAFHMHRAYHCFRQEGVDVTHFSTDFYTGKIQWTPAYLLIPRASALNKWSILIHEWIGVIAYDVVGYM